MSLLSEKYFLTYTFRHCLWLLFPFLVWYVHSSLGHFSLFLFQYRIYPHSLRELLHYFRVFLLHSLLRHFRRVLSNLLQILCKSFFIPKYLPVPLCSDKSVLRRKGEHSSRLHELLLSFKHSFPLYKCFSCYRHRFGYLVHLCSGLREQESHSVFPF